MVLGDVLWCCNIYLKKGEREMNKMGEKGPGSWRGARGPPIKNPPKKSQVPASSYTNNLYLFCSQRLPLFLPVPDSRNKMVSTKSLIRENPLSRPDSIFRPLTQFLFAGRIYHTNTIYETPSTPLLLILALSSVKREWCSQI